MQIEKINENQIEVILDLDDLKKNNISVHSFMCNSSASQSLFMSILGFANDEIGFDLKNHEIIVEAFSMPNCDSFVLVITRIPKTAHLHISKSKYGKLKYNKCFWIKFDKLEEFCMFCSSLKNELNINSSLYLLDGSYFLHIKVNKIQYYFGILSMASEFSNYIYDNNYLLDENAEIIIKKSAIHTCKKYFV